MFRKKTYTFDVIDYNAGFVGETIKLTSLAELEAYAKRKEYKLTAPEFKTGVLWVTKYSRFSQR